MKKILLASVAMMALISFGAAASAADWKLSATNGPKGDVGNTGAIGNAANVLSINSSIGNQAVGAGTSVTGTTISGALPNPGTTTISETAKNQGNVGNNGVIANALNAAGYGNSISNSAAGAVASVTFSGAGISGL